MIDLRELRIGNLVEHKGNYYPVKELGLDYGVHSLGTLKSSTSSHSIQKEIEPIPLTEEWLEKLGFNLKPSHGEDDPYYFVFGEGFELGWDKYGLDLISETGSINFPHIKYVHQLQNLYFALTGEELEIKNRI